MIRKKTVFFALLFAVSLLTNGCDSTPKDLNYKSEQQKLKQTLQKFQSQTDKTVSTIKKEMKK